MSAAESEARGVTLAQSEIGLKLVALLGVGSGGIGGDASKPWGGGGEPETPGYSQLLPCVGRPESVVQHVYCV